MKLGGNAAFIVFEDADLDAAVDGALTAKMRISGEACTAANRMYVHTDILAEFAKRLAQRMSELRMGRGVEDSIRVGPLIDEASRAKVQSLVERRGGTRGPNFDRWPGPRKTTAEGPSRQPVDNIRGPERVRSSA